MARIPPHRGLTAPAAQPIGFKMDAQRHKVRPHYLAAAHAAPETSSVVIPAKAGIALSVVQPDAVPRKCDDSFRS